MNIIGIELTNFKAYEKIKINCNEKFNVIIGPNNIGKSTILEAIFLWKSAFDIFIQERNSKRFYVGYNNRYLPFKDVFFLRAIEDSDIFFRTWNHSTIKLIFKIDEEILSMAFNIEKPGIRNTYLKVNYADTQSDFSRFASLMEERGISLKDSIFIYQTKPVSQITKEEPFYNNAQLIKKISLAKSHELIRNKILKTQKRQGALVNERFQLLEEKLQKVLEKQYSIRCKNKNTNDDEFIKITVKEGSKREVEIALMGSGFLQVVEIFSTLEFINKNPKCLNLILIDEPDSHIHSDLQYNLLNELRNQDNYQSFVISHNDRLIENIPEGELLFINDSVKSEGLLQPSPLEAYDLVKQELASKIENIKIEPNKHCYIITEDERTELIENYLSHNGFNIEECEVISYYGCDTIGAAITIGKYIRTKNAEAKILIHRDRDYLEADEIQDLREKVEKADFFFYCTTGVDIESEYLNAEHIHFLYNQISIRKASELISEATDRTERKSIDRLLKKKGQMKEFGIGVLDLYTSDKKRYRYGKKVLGNLKGLVQAEIGENPNLLSESEFIRSEALELFSKEIWEEVEAI